MAAESDRAILRAMLDAVRRRLAGAAGPSQPGGNERPVIIQRIEVRVDGDRDDEGRRLGPRDRVRQHREINPDARVAIQTRERNVARERDGQRGADPNEIYYRQQAVAAGFHTRFSPLGRYVETLTFRGLGTGGAQAVHQLGLLERAAESRGLTGVAAGARGLSKGLLGGAFLKELAQNVLPLITASLKHSTEGTPLLGELASMMDDLLGKKLPDILDQIDVKLTQFFRTSSLAVSLGTARLDVAGEKANLDPGGILSDAFNVAGFEAEQQILRQQIERRRRRERARDLTDILKNAAFKMFNP